MKLVFALLFSLIICTACSPAYISYPAFSAALESREAQFNKNGIKSFRFTMTAEGFGFEIDSDACPGAWPYAYKGRFNFDAKRVNESWVVYASPKIAEQETKESALTAFESMIDEVISQCEKVSEIKKSWRQ